MSDNFWKTGLASSPETAHRGGESGKGTDVLRLKVVALLAVLLLVSSGLWAQATQPARMPVELGRMAGLPGAAPTGGESFRFVVMGDRTGGHVDGIWEQAIREVNSLAPDFVICVGDLIEGYTEDPAQLATMWDEFSAITGKLNAPVFFCPGNHDVTNDLMLKEYIARWGKQGRSYYSFDYRGCHFVVLDFVSADRLPKFAQEQFRWLSADLAAAKDAQHVFVFYHYPCWTGPTAFWKRLSSMLDPAKSTVFNGHWHRCIFAQPDGISTYVVPGTAAYLPGRGVDMGEVHMLTQVRVADGQPTVAVVPVGQVRPGEYLPQELATQRSGVLDAAWIAPRMVDGRQELTIRQTNPLKVPIQVHFAPLTGDRELTGAADVTVEPGQAGKASLPLPASTADAPLQVRAKYTWTESTGQAVAITKTLQMPSVATPAPLAQGLVADGDLSDWSRTDAKPLDCQGEYAPEDLSCRMRVVHDQKYVHLAFEISDQSIYTDDPKISMNDSLELYWYTPDPAASAAPDVPTSGRVVLAAPKEGQPPTEPSWKIEPGQTKPEMKATCRLTPTGWLCEMTLRAAGLGMHVPLAGQMICWRLIVNDLDKVNGVVQDRKRLRAGGTEFASYIIVPLE
jgi:hypothetical protein